jgi:hypothetical protein
MNVVALKVIRMLCYSKLSLSQVLAAISVSLGSMIVGFVSSYTSPAIPSMKEYPGNLGLIKEHHVS